MKLLIVEDNERVAHFLKKGLSEAGHTADHANSGRDRTVNLTSRKQKEVGRPVLRMG